MIKDNNRYRENISFKEKNVNNKMNKLLYWKNLNIKTCLRYNY